MKTDRWSLRLRAGRLLFQGADRRRHSLAMAALGAALACGVPAQADDWPQWMGPERDGVWREKGVLTEFPAGGPRVLWRSAVNAGYCGPAVAGGRVYWVDRVAGRMERKRGDTSPPVVPGTERVACADAETGKVIWEQSYERGYSIAYPSGPRATPVVSDGRVYTLGAMGDLQCRDAGDGAAIWKRAFPEEFQAEPPAWGWAGHPLLDGDRLICTVGGTGSAIVAFHRDDGRELWRCQTAKEIGYAPPMIYELAGRRQLIFWHADGVASLDPETGRELWTHPYPVGGRPQRPEVTIAAPRAVGNRLFFTSFYQGSLMLEVANDPPSASVAWNRRSSRQSEMNDGLHTIMGTPAIRDGQIYGVCGFGELRCLDAATGDRVWESRAVTGGEKAFFANVFMVENDGRWFFFNDQGEMVLGRLSREGFEEIGRSKLLEPLENTRGRTVVWCHPAFAERSAFVHNGKEMIRVSLAAGSS